MSKVVSFSKGRLGNLMFCVASGKYYADKHGMDFYLLRNNSHDNYLSKVEKTFFKDIKMVNAYNKSNFEVAMERSFYDPVKRKTTKDLYIDGYRECPKYWNNDKKYIFNLFKPEEGIIEAIRKVYDIDFSQYVSINVRRGDYLKPDVQARLGLLKIDYFYNCINKFPTSQKFLVTSDDIEWCKTQFNGDNFMFVDRDVAGYEKTFVDLWIQTLCAHNIISNSTFSWWGAYLNKSSNRKVYYPYRFFKCTADRNKIPENDNWIEVPALWDTKNYTRKVNEEKKNMAISEGITKSQEAKILAWAKRFGVNISNPITISDKLNWLKLYDATPLKTKCADKLLLHEYSKEKLGKDICSEVLKVYNSPDEINLNELPDKFVLKCNHGSGMNIIVSDKSKLDIAGTKLKLSAWLKTDFSERFGETHYHNIKRKCYAEKYYGSNIKDYKFWCFNGEPKFFSIGSGGGHGAINHYDLDGNYLSGLSRVDYPSNPSLKYTMPKNLKEMIGYAKKLASDFLFVRVDFYEIEGKTILGEMTFVPGAGNVKYKDTKYNKIVGSYLHLPIKEQNHRVIYTCIAGNYEAIPHLSVVNKDFDYVCYTDQNVTDKVWDIRPIPDKLSNLSASLKNRYIKLHPHEFFGEYDLSIYIDGNVNIKKNVNDFLKENCSDEKCVLFAGKHPSRSCLYEEAKAVVKIKKDTPEHVNPQIAAYEKEGFPKNFGLTQNCILIRRHNDKKCIELMEKWWSEVSTRSHRDQLSLMYSIWKMGDVKYKIIDKDIFKTGCFLWGAVHKKQKTASRMPATDGAAATIMEEHMIPERKKLPPRKPIIIKTAHKGARKTPRTRSMKALLGMF